MALFEWQDNLSVGIAEIDMQHKKFIDLINQLHDVLLTEKSAEKMNSIFWELMRYVSEHFATEEKYFIKYHYLGTDSHIKEHIDFENQVKEFQIRFERGEQTISIEILSFLKDWLIKHIKGTDQKYTTFFHEQGLK